MNHFFVRPDATAAFRKRATPQISVDDSNVTSSKSPDDVVSALKNLNARKLRDRMKLAIHSTVMMQTRLRRFSQHATLDGWSAACSRRLSMTRIFNV